MLACSQGLLSFLALFISSSVVYGLHSFGLVNIFPYSTAMDDLTHISFFMLVSELDYIFQVPPWRLRFILGAVAIHVFGFCTFFTLTTDSYSPA